MNVTEAARPSPPRSPRRRLAGLAAAALLVLGPGALAHSAASGARFEVVVGALGLTAGGAVVVLLLLSPGLHVVHDD